MRMCVCVCVYVCNFITGQYEVKSQSTGTWFGLHIVQDVNFVL